MTKVGGKLSMDVIPYQVQVLQLCIKELLVKIVEINIIFYLMM